MDETSYVEVVSFILSAVVDGVVRLVVTGSFIIAGFNDDGGVEAWDGCWGRGSCVGDLIPRSWCWGWGRSWPLGVGSAAGGSA